ncbi:alpha/beta fold hydrolase [Streptomyces sp. ITFR-6]|uniref:thioesterase II family protein n=1 Tax=Streptomyces sp. ITFR-6 TaxID=3075197 RepID=UPI002889DB5F|nr:alpha/beta fold hydrolase [Streptomyces sp. ITFR-6]WNI30987.1 alpha/beta fold hydrolase [Streptomyces sp. ITFR-6]
MTAWIQEWTPHLPDGAATARILCLPYAGAGAAAYRTWATAMPPGAELHAVELPGHGRRLPEPPGADLTEIIEALTPLAARPGPPLVLFGHSMGALLAYELCRALTTFGAAPAALVLSAMSPAHLVDRTAQRALAENPDALLDHVRELGATPPEVLHTAALRELVLRTMRADLRLLAAFPDPATDDPLPANIPVTALSGQTDRLYPPHTVAAWTAIAERWEGMHVLPGGHFFPWQGDTGPRLVAALAQTAASAARPA